MKRTLILLLTATLFVALVGCQKTNDELPPVLIDETTGHTTITSPQTKTVPQTEPVTEPVTELVTEPGTEPVTEPVTEPATEQLPQNDDKYSEYTGISNIEVFLHDLWERQAEQGGDVGVNSQNHSVSVIVPVLKNDDYKFSQLSNPGTGENEYLRWDYILVGQHPHNPYDDVKVEIYLGITDHDKFIQDSLGMLILNEEYHAGYLRPTWYFQMEGYSVSVRMPETELETYGEMIPLERVFEYFDFEVVTYSPTAETNAVQ